MFIIIQENADPENWVFPFYPHSLRSLWLRIPQKIHGESICLPLPITKEAGKNTLKSFIVGGKKPKHKKPAAEDPRDWEDSQINRKKRKED